MPREWDEIHFIPLCLESEMKFGDVDTVIFKIQYTNLKKKHSIAFSSGIF
jgi:hypothetical protein